MKAVVCTELGDPNLLEIKENLIHASKSSLAIRFIFSEKFVIEINNSFLKTTEEVTISFPLKIKSSLIGFFNDLDFVILLFLKSLLKRMQS